MQIIDGRALAEKIKDEIVKEIAGNRKGLDLVNCPRPNLAIILVGDREDSELYVSLKEKEAKKVGIDTHLYRCEENISERELLDTIGFLNNDDSIDGILVQLPLPENFDTDKIIRAIALKKDVDGFHPDNLNKIINSCNHDGITPPVFGVVLEMLKSVNYDLKGEQVCVLANSDIFGKSLAKILECRGAKVEVVKSDDVNLEKKTKEADLLITALGRAQFVKREMLKDGAIIIDIGIAKEDGKVYGDVDFDDASEVASFITPVPGGVGPMTIAMAFKNTLELYKKRRKDC